MAWIYLAESVESALDLKNGPEPSLTVKETDTLSLCSCRECFLVTSTKLQSGMTLHRLAGPCFQELTSSLEGSPVKTSVLQDVEQAWQESEADYSTRLSGLQKKLSQRLCSSKTYPQLELVDFERSLEHLPKWGMTVDGLVYLPQALELHTKESDGFYLPTPAASAGQNSLKRRREMFLGQRKPDSLVMMAKYNFWPTPIAGDWKTSPNQVIRPRDMTKLSTKIYSENRTGHLNPTWVEWLMGYPLEWTVLNALVTQWFLSKSKRRLKNSQELTKLKEQK